MSDPEIAKLGLWKKPGIFEENEALRHEIAKLKYEANCADELHQQDLQTIDGLRQQVAELVEVLHEGVRSLTDDQPAIVDVVWCATQPCETLHDYFVAAIAKAKGAA